MNDAATVAEDAAATAIDVLANDTDVDAGPISIDAVIQPANGTVVITGGGTGLTYQPNADYCNDPPGTTPDTFTYTLNGGSTATVSVTVTCVDDSPVAVDDTTTVTEDASATGIDVLANDTDVDGGPVAVASVTQPANGTVVITGGGTGLSYQPNANYCNDPPGTTPDTFTYTVTGGSTATVSVTVTCVDDPPVAVNDAATVAEDAAATAVDVLGNDTDPDGGPISIGSVTQPASGTVRHHRRRHRADLPAERQLLQRPARHQPCHVHLHPDPGGSTATVSVTVTCVSDPPTAVDDTGTTDEDTTLTATAPGVLANDTDPDAGDTKSVVGLNGSTTLTGASAEGATVTINANGSYTYNPGSVFQGLTTGQTDTDTFTYTMADAAGAQSTATVTLTITGVADAPVATADSFDAVGNTGLFVGTTRPAGEAGKQMTGSVLANDTDVDTPQASLVAEPVTNAPTTLGGTITINSDGSFVYQPDDGDTGVTDTFTYRVCDATPCTASTVANTTGTLSLPIAGQVWYVRNDAAAGGDGTSDTPFDTLAEAEAASGTGDTVYVFDGDNTSTNLDTGYAMEANERLIGEAVALTLDPDGGGPLTTVTLHPATAGARPTLTATGEDVVTLASGALVSGLELNPTGAGGGIFGGSAVTGSTIADVTIIDSGTTGTQPGLELVGTSGTFNVSNLAVSTNGAIGVRLFNAGTVNFLTAGTISIASAGARALDVTDTNLGSSSFNTITVTGSPTGGVSLTNTPGTAAFGDLSLTTTAGPAAAFHVSNAGNVSVRAGGIANVSATGGPAIDVTGTPGATLPFDDVSSTGSTTDGINLAGLGVGTFSATGGTISGAAGIAFDLDGGSGNITYPGALNNGSGATAEITNRTGGTVTLSGAVADTNDAGGGITISGNTGGSTTFSNASKVLNTGTGAAISMTSNAGHTVAFTGGGLDVDTTSGAGLTATGGGTLTVRGHRQHAHHRHRHRTQRRQHHDRQRRADVPGNLRQRRSQRHRPQHHRHSRKPHGDRRRKHRPGRRQLRRHHPGHHGARDLADQHHESVVPQREAAQHWRQWRERNTGQRVQLHRRHGHRGG